MSDNEKVKAILDAPRPNTKKQVHVRSFIGMAGLLIYRKFIPTFGEISAPLIYFTKT